MVSGWIRGHGAGRLQVRAYRQKSSDFARKFVEMPESAFQIGM
jgi:hypothetical protein